MCYRWSKELFGYRPALAALLLWCFSPNILAHAQLLTPDVGVTALSLAACYACWRWSSVPTWLQSFIAGGVLGLAVLAKTNAVALYPALVVGISLHAIAAKRLRTRKTVAQVIVAFAISLYVINLGYGFEGSLRPLGDYEFFSNTLGSNEGSNRFRSTILENAPVPLPAPFLEGMDLQRRDLENSDGIRKTYLRGQWYDHGWWWYYFYVIAVKVPVGTWVLVLIGGAVVFFRNNLPHRADSICYLMIPGVALFALACSQTGFGHSLRYVLPAFPFAFVIAGAAMGDFNEKRWRYLSLAALTWMLVSRVFVFPHSLSYFNELAGGPRNGHFHLLDGNVDWGQDVLYARNWIESHPHNRPVYTACWSFLPLKKMGGTFEEPDLRDESPIPPGWYVISVNHLRKEYRRGRPELARFLQYEPTELVTYTLYVYRIPSVEVTSK
ncbi:MAG: glycosyltransferase family 39 protein [Planctomycetes bacterium]|nr:glycosyltransferase family 39 protein [Planctomycetota bacterium]